MFDSALLQGGSGEITATGKGDSEHSRISGQGAGDLQNPGGHQLRCRGESSSLNSNAPHFKCCFFILCN